jgi:hypothetical protein
MHLTALNFAYLGHCLEGFFFGAISVLQLSHFLKSFFIPGLYSGIFVGLRTDPSRMTAVQVTAVIR